MNTRHVTGKYVAPAWVAPLALALFVAQGSACAADADQPEVTVKPSERSIAAAGASAGRAPTIVPPAEAAAIPRSVAMQKARHITVVSHDDLAAVSDGAAGGSE